MIKELVVVSGKGGTGKTSITASFAALATDKVLADCDVDAADLHLVLEPKIIHRESFSGGSVARIDPEKCTQCGTCRELCRFDAISKEYEIDGFGCEGCGVCADNCPEHAVEMLQKTAGEWYVSDTRHGPMVHARLVPGEENSGKLVSMVRTRAREIAGERGYDLLLIDGSPGIGCPVIASVTGATLMLAVTEPTLSGIHDLERILSLARHFQIPSAVCINKFDINPVMTEKIEAYCAEEKIPVSGRISFDSIVTKAQVARVSVVEYSGGRVAKEMEKVWRDVSLRIAAIEAAGGSN